jgi:hypothetical protein
MQTPTNSSKIDPAARESQAIDFLDAFPRGVGPVLIGGYAIAAYGPPRFSVDVDLVLPAARDRALRSWLDSQEMNSRETMNLQTAKGSLSKLMISRELVSGDIFLGGLRARESGAVVEYDWIARETNTERLTLTTGSTRLPFPIARPEVLWVLKLLAGRPQDLTDLFVISGWSVDSTEITSELKQLADPKVRTHLRDVASRLSTGKEYSDALSRRGLGSPTDAQNQRLWKKFKEQALSYLPP